MHFMPLQDFSLEIAQNHSLIVALRMARLEGRTELLDSHEISVWRHTLMSRLTAEIIAGSTPPGGRVIDIGSFSGVHFEELKLCWKHPSNASEYEVVIDPPKARQMFEGLHPRTDWEYQLRAHGTMATAHPRDTLFVNHAAAIRGAIWMSRIFARCWDAMPAESFARFAFQTIPSAGTGPRCTGKRCSFPRRGRSSPCCGNRDAPGGATGCGRTIAVSSCRRTTPPPSVF